MRKTIFVALIAVWISSCQQQQTGSANFDKTSVAEEIRKVTTSIYQAGNDRNAAKLYSHFSDNVTGIFDGVIMTSWDDHKKEGKAFFGSQKEIRYTIDSIYSIDVISNEVTVLTGTYSL
jgi:transposase-like protein